MKSFQVMEISSHNYKLCTYDCGREGKYFLKTVKKWCCESSHNKCSINRKKNSEALTGRKRDPELMKRIGLAQRGKIINKEHREKLSKAALGKKHTTETRRKISKANIGVKKIYNLESDKRRREKLRLICTGPGNPNWKGGKSFEPYCHEFTIELKNYIKERDKYKCQNPFCEGKSIRLAVHHIDYKKKNCDPLNLITVCNCCNSTANKDREWWTCLYREILRRRGFL